MIVTGSQLRVMDPAPLSLGTDRVDQEFEGISSGEHA